MSDGVKHYGEQYGSCQGFQWKDGACGGREGLRLGYLKDGVVN